MCLLILGIASLTWALFETPAFTLTLGPLTAKPDLLPLSLVSLGLFFVGLLLLLSILGQRSFQRLVASSLLSVVVAILCGLLLWVGRSFTSDIRPSEAFNKGAPTQVLPTQRDLPPPAVSSAIGAILVNDPFERVTGRRIPEPIPPNAATLYVILQGLAPTARQLDALLVLSALPDDVATSIWDKAESQSVFSGSAGPPVVLVLRERYKDLTLNIRLTSRTLALSFPVRLETLTSKVRVNTLA